MPVRNTLPGVLRGEDAPDLSAESRDQLEAMAVDAKNEGDIVFVRDECAARLRQDDATLGVEYLLAEACWLNGESERAHQTLLTLGDKLVDQSEWEALAAIVDHALAINQTQAAARLLVKAHEGLKRDPERIEALKRAWVILSDDLELGLLVAVRLGEAGRHDERRALLSELIPKFAEGARYAGLEEAALEFVEKEDIAGLVALVQTLPLVAKQEAHEEAVQLLEIAFPPIAKAGSAAECLDVLREAAALETESQGATGGDPFRGPLVEALRQGPAKSLPDPAPVFAASGIEDRMKSLLPALEAFDKIAALPPGRAVFHDAFGAGRLKLNDGENVAVDFAGRSGHRMPYPAARRTLTRIDDDDLRLLIASDPEKLARMCKEEPAEIILRALGAVGGSATAQKLKVFIVGSKLMPASEWTSFWRRARAAAAKDPRIDSSRAFEQFFQVADVGGAAAAGDAPLPALELRKSVRMNLATLRKFLSQHPDGEEALAGRFGRYIERAVLDENADRVDRARAGLYFARWRPERSGQWVSVLKTLWEQGLAITNLAGEDEQLALLKASHNGGVESDAILSALDSRFSAVREAAGRYRAQLDDQGRALLRNTLLRHASRYPGAALRGIEEELAATPPPSDPWRVFYPALSLIEEKPKASVAQKVLRWLEADGAFEQLLRGQVCPEETRLQIRLMLRQWRSSDRYLFPALEAVERLGLREEVEIVRSDRQRNTARLFDRVGQQAEEQTTLPVMTRATWGRLNEELEKHQRELRTTIPAAIERARELGDLKENAEYHSAKLKQSNVSNLVASLQLRLKKARFVDEAEFRDGIVGLGTEVRLEGDGEAITYWILGEGEHHLGDDVVSFQAPVGRALMGRSVGDNVELGPDDNVRRYRVVSIERKLPTTEPESTS